MKRREFIKNATCIAVGSALIPQFLAGCTTDEVKRYLRGYKRLVVLHLGGGNDGLNTIVPFRNDIYYKLRPQLAIPPEKVLKLNDELGAHPAIEGLKKLYDRGYLAIFNNVGYPDIKGYPSIELSHFKASDIWSSGLTPDKDRTPQHGWLGKYLDLVAAKSEDAFLGVEASTSFELSLKGEKIQGININSLETINRLSDYRGYLVHSHEHEHPIASYIREVSMHAVFSTDVLNDYFKEYSFSYPDSELAGQFRKVAALIKGGAPTRCFFLKHATYDSHQAQVGSHEKLLKEMADAVHAFATDLETSGLFDDTLILIYSEFGRRVAENRNLGTDHGRGNNLFVISGSLKKQGILNELPDLETLAYRNDVAVHLDFRRIYATILERWLEVPAEKVLGERFPLLDFV